MAKRPAQTVSFPANPSTKLEELMRGRNSQRSIDRETRRAGLAESLWIADRDRKLANTLETIPLGSMNKMFPSVAIARLVEANKVKFSDTIATRFPDYPNKEVTQKEGKLWRRSPPSANIPQRLP